MDYSYLPPATVPKVSFFAISEAMDNPYTYIISALVLVIYITLSQTKSAEIAVAVKDEEDEEEAETQLLQLEDVVQGRMNDFPEAIQVQLQRLHNQSIFAKSMLHNDEQDDIRIDAPSNVSQSPDTRDALPLPSPRISMPPTTTTNHPKMPHTNARLAACTTLPRLKPRRSFVASRQTLQHPAPMVHSAPRVVSQPRFLDNPVRPAYQEQSSPPVLQQLPLHQAQPFPPILQQLPLHQAQPAPTIFHQPLSEKLPFVFAKLSSGIAQNLSVPQWSLPDLLVFFQWFAPSPQVQQPVEAPQQCSAPLNTFQPSNQGTLRPEAIPTDEHPQATNDDLRDDDHDMENQIMEDIEQPPNVDMDTGEDAIQVPAVMIPPVPIAHSVQEEKQNQQLLQPNIDPNALAELERMAQGELTSWAWNFAQSCLSFISQQFSDVIATEEDELLRKQKEYQYQQAFCSNPNPVVYAYQIWHNLRAATQNQYPESNLPTTSEQTQPELPPPETPASSEESEATAASYADFMSAMVNTTDVPRGRGGDAFQYPAAQSRGANGTRYPYKSVAQREKEEDSLRNSSLKARSQKDTACQLPTMPLASSSTSSLRVGADGQRQAVVVERIGSEEKLRARLHEERDLDMRLIHEKKKREVREAKAKAKAKTEAKAQAKAEAKIQAAAKAEAEAIARAETEAKEQALLDAEKLSATKRQAEDSTATQKYPHVPTLFAPAFSTVSRPLKRHREEEAGGLAPPDAGAADATKSDLIPPVKKRFRFSAPEILCEYKEFFKESILGPVAGTTTTEEVVELTRPSCLRLAPEAPTPKPRKTCLKPARPFEHWYTNLYGPSEATFAQGPSKRPRQAMESDSPPLPPLNSSSSSARLLSVEVHRLRVAARKEATKKQVNKSMFSSIVATLCKPLTRKRPATVKTTSWVPTTGWSRTPTSNHDSR